MVTIISKRDGPRREDAEIKRFLHENRGTIDQMANHLTNGAWQARRKPGAVPEPEARSSTRVAFATGGAPRPAEPYVRISPNDRVVVMDGATGRQLEFIGEIRGSRKARHFVLATGENGFIAPLDDAARHKLADLDGVGTADEDAEDRLKHDISVRLGLAEREA